MKLYYRHYISRFVYTSHVVMPTFSNKGYAADATFLSILYLLTKILVIIVLSIHYNVNLINVINSLNLIIYDACVLLPLIILVNTLFTNIITYTYRYNLYLHICEWLEILLLIVDEVFRYICKVVITSIKFRMKLSIIMLMLIWLGLDQNLVYYVVITYILLLVVTNMYVSNNKAKQLFKLIVNLAIIYAFWYNVEDLNTINIVILLMHNNMILTFDEWDLDFEIDLSDTIDSLNLHGYSIGDPSIIPPIPPRFKSLVDDPSDVDTENTQENSGKKYPDPRLFSSWKMHMPEQDNYRDFIVVNDINYTTDVIQKAFELKPKVNENDMLVKKRFIIYYENKWDYLLTPRFVGQSIEDHKLELEWSMYQLSFEYNTLVKANTYYFQKGLDTQGEPLHHSYKDAAEGWQKRQIYIHADKYVDIHDKFKNNPEDMRYVNFSCNDFNNETSHHIVRENLFWIKSFLIQAHYTLSGLETKDNNLSLADYDTKIRGLNKDCYDKHKIAFEVKKEYNIWYWNNKHNVIVDPVFKQMVRGVFYNASKNIKL